MVIKDKIVNAFNRLKNKLKGVSPIRLAVLAVLLLVVSIFANYAVLPKEYKYTVSSDAVTLSVEEENIQGYSVDKWGNYSPTISDPWLEFKNVNREVACVYMAFTQNTSENIDVQVFFAKNGDEFSEQNSVWAETVEGKGLIINIPKDDYRALRIDFNGPFNLEKVQISAEAGTQTKVAAQNLSVAKIAFSFLMLAIFVSVAWLMRQNKHDQSLSKYEIIYLIFCFGFYLLWICNQHFNYAPDEAMRYDVSLFTFLNNRLPQGAETCNEIWGFSYAHVPTMLCSYLSYIPMKIVSIFTNSTTALLLAARTVSAAASVGTVYFCFKIGKLCLNHIGKWVLAVFVSIIPQFVFLSSYVNNDSLAVFGVSIIIYSWVHANKYNWSYFNCFTLAIGVSVCALSYYNSYAWVLMSVFFFIITYLSKNKKDMKGLFKHGFFIVGIVLVLVSYAFIRHLILYNDLLGYKACDYYGELYALDYMRPSNRLSLSQQGYSLKQMILDMEWVKLTYRSFIGVFGYMNAYSPKFVYDIYTALFTVSGIGLIVGEGDKLFVKKNKPEFKNVMLYLSIGVAMAITVLLSVINSYTTDFQPQGRYCYPIIIGLGLIVAKGISYIALKIQSKPIRYALVGAFLGMLVTVTIGIYYTVFLPTAC